MATRVNQPQPNAKKSNKTMLTAIIVLGVIFTLVPMLIGLYTDFLWFGELDFRGVFNRVIIARVVLFIVFALLGGGIAYLAAWLAWRGRPEEMPEADLFRPAHSTALPSSRVSAPCW